MREHDGLAAEFDTHRTHLHAVAYRMLGSPSEAEDVVQEAWLRMSRSDVTDVCNLRGWLTTVVARACLDVLRARRPAQEGSMPHESLDADEATAGFADALAPDPESELLLADAIGPALLVVLDRLAPAERLAFVLHDLFAVPFDDVAAIVGRTPTAARQLASRARRRVQGAAADGCTDFARQRQIVEAFLAASRNGDFAALIALLDPDVVLRADAATVLASAASQAEGAPKIAARVRGANAVADTFCGRARAARAAVIDGRAGAVFAPGGTPRVAFVFTVVHGRIAGIDVVGDPATLGAATIAILD